MLDRNGLEVLSRDECLRLLGGCTFGRVGVTMGALPAVLPINYRLIGDRIVFRTSGGTKLDAAIRGAVVAFEVDDLEPLAHSGWSVMVTGIAQEVTEPGDLQIVEAAGVPRWAPAPAEHVVQISTEMISGRRIR
jgi:nitroimidazol reductase NimA-like FMN-containing flavoprotein (pyridoxamine 5'-phosphate oxidase superfamily)